MQTRGIEPKRLDPRESADLVGFLQALRYFDPPGDTGAGRRLFVEKKCVQCHQVRGFGGVEAPSLDPISGYAPIQVAAALWNHGPAMSEAMRERGIERPSFSGAELNDLIAYLRSAGEGRLPAEPVFALPGRASEGRRLFEERRCIDCHRASGPGGRLGPNLARRAARESLIDLAAAMWNKAPAMLEAMQHLEIEVPRLSAAEMADLVAYLESVQYFAGSGDPQRGRRRLGETGCLGCHWLGSRGAGRASDLDRAARVDSASAVLSVLWNHVMIAGASNQVAWPELDPDQVADLSAFLMRPEPPRP